MDCWQDTESQKLYCSLGPFCTKITEAEVRLHNLRYRSLTISSSSNCSRVSSLSSNVQ